jgi:hypothetical protein
MASRKGNIRRDIAFPFGNYFAFSFPSLYSIWLARKRTTKFFWGPLTIAALKPAEPNRVTAGRPDKLPGRPTKFFQ